MYTITSPALTAHQPSFVALAAAALEVDALAAAGLLVGHIVVYRRGVLEFQQEVLFRE